MFMFNWQTLLFKLVLTVQFLFIFSSLRVCLLHIGIRLIPFESQLLSQLFTWQHFGYHDHHIKKDIPGEILYLS